MITLDLKARFEDLAYKDHLYRMQVLLGELDLDQSYSKQADFPQQIADLVETLQSMGIHTAYQQACVLLSVFVCGVSLEALPATPELKVIQCINTALGRGVSRGAYQHLHNALAGVGRIDQAWLDLQPESDCLGGNSNVQAKPLVTRLACVHEGPVDTAMSNELPALATQANFLRMGSGFQHKLFGDFNPLSLLGHVCQSALPADPWVVLPNPLFERCELGVSNQQDFIAVQQIQLLDARHAKVNFTQREFEWTAFAQQDLQASWESSSLFGEAIVRFRKSFLQGDCSCQAGWRASETNPEFCVAGEMQLRIPAASLQWQANVFHVGVFLGLTIQIPREVNVLWSFDDKRPNGQLPIGEPWLIKKELIALDIQVAPVVCVGKPMLNTLGSTVGELQVSLFAKIDPDSHRLDLSLAVSHSELLCRWQTMDPLLGGSSGLWLLAPPAQIAQWDLSDG